MAISSTERTDVNRSAILAHLGASGPASRAELARTLSVSPALMTQLTRELISDGLVVELESAPSSGGRPARMLGLVAGGGRAIGIKVVADHIAFVEVGIDGRVLRSQSEPFDAAAATSLAELADRIRSFIDGGADAPLLGVGVGVPGSVDLPGSGVVDAPQLDWVQVPIGESLRRSLGLPVIVENNVNALAAAERLFGLGHTAANFLVVTIGTGVGAAVVANGRIMRGASGGAGELGHVPVADEGPACRCGNRGCLEAYISEDALVSAGRERGVIPAGAGISELLDAADRGESGAIGVFEDAGRLLGRTLAGVVQVVDPALVIVLGEGTAAWAHWSRGFEPEFRAHLMARRRSIPVEVERWQDDSWAQGAAALVLATPFESEGLTGDQGRLIRARLVEQAARP